MEHQQIQAYWMEPLWHQSFWAMQNCKLGETRFLNVYSKCILVFKIVFFLEIGNFFMVIAMLFLR